MIRALVGNIGAGKSMTAMELIAHALAETDRDVATNIVIKPEGLAAYIQKEFPGVWVDIASRVRVLTRAEGKEFWMHRGPGVDLALKADGEPNYTGVTKGVFYVIDEAHIDFDSRCWAKSSKNLTFYNSQHRKLDDEVWFVTQFLELVDSRVRGFAEEYCYVENNANMRYLGVFKGLKYVTVSAYKSPRAKSGKSNGICVWSKRLRFNKGLLATYDTSAGVGMPGIGRPEQKKFKGISILWAIPLVVLVVVLVAQIPGAIGSIFSRKVKKDLAPTAQPAAAVSPNSAPGPAASLDADKKELPYPTGVAFGNGRVCIAMSDGTTVIEGQYDSASRNGVQLAGRFFAWKPSKARDVKASVVPSDRPSAIEIGVKRGREDRGSWELCEDGVERLKSGVK